MRIPTLAEHTTLRVGGPADAWILATSDDEIVEAVRECDDTGTPLLLLGDGSNLVVADAGFRGTVIEIASRGASISAGEGFVDVSVAAGEPWDLLVSQAVGAGWSGIEALSGIPGRCGATPVQNVGAYGQEVAHVVRSVDVFDRERGELATLDNAACGFGYRSSIFKDQPGRWVVLSVTFRLPVSALGSARYAELARALDVPLDGEASVEDIRTAVIELRRGKGMVLDPLDHDTWSAGSFFTNPIVGPDVDLPEGCPRYPAAEGTKLSAAWLIEQSGIRRGYSLGSDAAISTKHTLALCNRGSATTADVVALARDVQRRVVDAFGVELAIEPTLVG